MKRLPDQKKRHINNSLIVCLLLLMVITIIIFMVNIIRISTNDTGAGNTMATAAANNELVNDQYHIGNNPTDINKTYFKELTQALKGNQDTFIAQSLVKSFVTEYYTWTNKDGNYDIGGMQYIFAPKKSDFAEYTVWNFYQDMDLYITKYGTSNLMQVKDVTISNAVNAGNYTVQLPGDESEVTSSADAAVGKKEELSCIDVTAAWTYEDNSTVDTSQFQKQAVFHVVNNSGRWEIAGITAE